MGDSKLRDLLRTTLLAGAVTMVAADLTPNSWQAQAKDAKAKEGKKADKAAAVEEDKKVVMPEEAAATTGAEKAGEEKGAEGACASGGCGEGSCG